MALFKKALNFYQKYAPTDYQRICLALIYIGTTYRENGDYKQAKDTMQKVINLHNKHLPERITHFGWYLTLLGNVYRDLGDYGQSYEKLKQGVENFIKLQKQINLKETMPWQDCSSC